LIPRLTFTNSGLDQDWVAGNSI